MTALLLPFHSMSPFPLFLHNWKAPHSELKEGVHFIWARLLKHTVHSCMTSLLEHNSQADHKYWRFLTGSLLRISGMYYKFLQTISIHLPRASSVEVWKGRMKGHFPLDNLKESTTSQWQLPLREMLRCIHQPNPVISLLLLEVLWIGICLLRRVLILLSLLDKFKYHLRFGRLPGILGSRSVLWIKDFLRKR